MYLFTQQQGTLSLTVLDENGAAKNAEKLTSDIKTEWADFIPTTTITGTPTPKPVATGGSAKSKDEIMAIKDTAARQRAIAENLELRRIR